MKSFKSNAWMLPPFSLCSFACKETVPMPLLTTTTSSWATLRARLPLTASRYDEQGANSGSSRDDDKRINGWLGN